MNLKDIINKKGNSKALSKQEIEFFVNGYTNGEISDDDMTLLLKAICEYGMDEIETTDLTNAMLDSGEKLDLSKINGIVVDKHSTGGVGDKTSLVVLPLASSAGVKIAKMSGRSLGFTGGTIDKLESIDGFNVEIPEDKFIKQVNDIGMALVSQTTNLVPADKKIYALRDKTGTVDSIPLIASSVMSKKLASGADKILLDVKVGKGAFMKNYENAKHLAELMTKIGKNNNKNTIALLTNMDYPLGKAIGNGLEVEEAIETLNGNGEKNFLNLCILEASYMLHLSKDISITDAIDIIEEKYKNKEGLRKFQEFVYSQGGNINKIDICENKVPIYSSKDGYVTDIDTMTLANYVKKISTKNDKIDHGVGIVLNKHYGDKVEKGDILFYVYTNDNDLLDENVFKIEENKKEDLKTIYEIIK